MNKTTDIDLYRLFLIDDLPEPLNRASSHLQIFDNYVHGTRIRLRKIRDPYTGKWTHLLHQKTAAGDDGAVVRKTHEIHLNEQEYGVFQIFERHEIRKNRYFHEFGADDYKFDVYMGDLAGLTTARVDFVDQQEMDNFEPPPFAVFEITNDPFFAGVNLVGKRYDSVRAEVARLGSGLPKQIDMSDE